MNIINKNILFIPPYISTTWHNVQTIQVKENAQKPLLIIYLKTGEHISIPQLNKETRSKIFHMHAYFLSQHALNQVNSEKKRENRRREKRESTHLISVNIPCLQSGCSQSPQMLEFLLPIMGLGNFEANHFCQHNAQLAEAPTLPKDLLQMIFLLAKEFSCQIQFVTPNPRKRCHCFYCQISRSILYGMYAAEEEKEERVKDEDLCFREWNIYPLTETLFRVQKASSLSEKYMVSLSKPVQCSCQQPDCEHIKMVLRS